jgi:hypothetical protein
MVVAKVMTLLENWCMISDVKRQVIYFTGSYQMALNISKKQKEVASLRGVLGSVNVSICVF